MSSPLNIPSSISAADLLAAGLTQSEIANVSDVLSPAEGGEAAAGGDTPAAPETPAEAADSAPHAADMSYDGDEMPGTDGTDGEIVVVDATNEMGEGDGIVIREYDPVRDGEDADKAATDADKAKAAPEDAAAPEGGDLNALLDLRRPEPPTPAKDFAAEQQSVRDQMKSLQEQYDDGDLTEDEFATEKGKLDDQLVDLRAEQRVFADGAKPAMDAYRESWFDLVGRHMEANPILRDDPEVMEGFDAILKQVSGDPRLSRLPAGQQVEIAHRRLGEAYLVARGEAMPDMVSLRSHKPAPQPQEKATAKDGKPQPPRKDARPDAPVTLAGIAGAQPDSLTGDPVILEVKRLIDSGDAIAAERAVARLSPAQLSALDRL